MNQDIRTKSNSGSLPEGLTLRASLGIGVQDAWHRRGIGSALMTELTELTELIDLADLADLADNWPAIPPYRKFGFVEEGRSRGFALRDGILADVLHMARLVDAPRLQTI